MITRAAQKIDNGHIAQVNTLSALLYSNTLYSILSNSDQAMYKEKLGQFHQYNTS